LASCTLRYILQTQRELVYSVAQHGRDRATRTEWVE